MNPRKRRLELMVLGGAAFVLSGAVLSLVLDTEGTALEGNPAWRLVLAVTYLGVALVLLPWYRDALFVVRRNWSLVALLLLALLSSLWSEMPDLVLRKCIALFGMTLYGVALAVRVSLQEQLRVLSWLFRILAVLSLACVLLLPAYGISKEGDWMGVFDYKNALGSAMGLSLLIESQVPAHTGLSRVLKALFMLLSAVLLLNSDSVTPAVVLIVALVLLNIYKFAALRLHVPLYVLVVIVVILGSVGLSLLVSNSDRVTALLGRSSNLTGRTEIWSLVLSFIPQRPILGYGYSGFWLGASPESLVVNRVMRGPVMYSHNGYLEMLLTLGAIGLLLTLILIGSGVKRALYLSRHSFSSTALWPLAFLLYFIIHNAGECTIMVQDIEWALCVSCIIGADPLLFACKAQEDEMPLISMVEPA